MGLGVFFLVGLIVAQAVYHISVCHKYDRKIIILDQIARKNMLKADAIKRVLQRSKAGGLCRSQ